MTTDVLVVGAGPTGLVLASELLRRGLSVRVVDKLAAPTRHSRALGVHARSLEILDDLGVADELISRGLRVTGATMRTPTATAPLVSIDLDGLDTRYPFVLCVSQVETETVLRDLLARRGGTIERETELVSFAEVDGGVEAVLRTPRGEERARASWIVGCDGAHSGVRHALDVEFEGHAYEETFVLADVRIDWDAAQDRIATFMHESGAAAFFPMKGGRWRLIATNAESLTATPAPSLADVAALIEPRVGRALAMSDAEWIAPFRVHCRQVARYRHGRAFLAGDAAHIHSPIGGQGMNTGMQDAHNLAWKLALVAHGRGHDALLDSYDAERHAIGKQVLAQTDRMTRIGLLHGVMASVRNQLARILTAFEPVRRAIARGTAELEIGYEDSPIVGEHVTSAWRARIGRAEAGESPTVGSRRAFGGAPGPGGRALDGAVRHGDTATQLCKLVRGDAFTLLLFDGRNPSPDGYTTLAAIAARVRDRFGDRVASYVVTPRADRPAELPASIDVVHDTSGELDERYGASTECLYLIRPDLYVGFRSQPADGDALVAYLDRLLV